MADKFAELIATIKADNRQFIAKMVETQAVAGKTGSAMSAGMVVATGAVVAGVASIGVAIGASVNHFANFDQAMTKSTSIMTGLTAEMRNEMALTARQIGLDSVQSAESLAESYYFLASAGLSAEQSMASLPVVANFATAGAFDLALATDLLTDAQTALGMASADAGENMANMVRISDALANSSVVANASIQQFSESLTNDAANAMKSLNIDLNTGLSALSAYASVGKKGAEAGTLFGRAIRLLSKSAIDNADAFKQMGIEVYDAEGQTKDFIGIIKQMESALDDLSPKERAKALKKLGFEALAQKSITPLIGMSKAMEGYRTKIAKTGTTQEVAEKQMNTMNAQLTLLGSSFSELGLLIGAEFAPAITKAVKDLKTLLDGLIAKWAEVRVGMVYATTGIDMVHSTLANLIIYADNSVMLMGKSFQWLGNFILDTFSNVGALLQDILSDPFNFDLETSTRNMAKAMTKSFMDFAKDVESNKVQYLDLDDSAKGALAKIKEIRAKAKRDAEQSAVKPAVATAKGEEGKTTPSSGLSAVKRSYGLSGALEKGTVGAYSAEQRKSQDAVTDTANNTKKMVELQKETVTHLKRSGGLALATI